MVKSSNLREIDFPRLFWWAAEKLFSPSGEKNKKLINIYKQKALNKAHAKID